MTAAQEYLGAIIRRSRERMEPVDFEVDWVDMPRRSKFYRDVPHLQLHDVCGSADPGPNPLADPGPNPPADSGAGQFDLPTLAEMLLQTYAESDRRLAIHANSDVDELPLYHGASFSRGVASGGGRYPVSIYWVVGAGGPVSPGIYYYCTATHTMQLLLAGDVTALVGQALGDDALASGQYLVLGIKFWQNAFKYNSFCFHAVTMDIGTVTEAWRLWGADRGFRLRPALWFDEHRLADLLGLQPAEEGVFAVVPLPVAATGASGVRTQADGDAEVLAVDHAGRRGPRIAARDEERSLRVLEFDAVTTMQKATSADCADRPEPSALASAAPVNADPAGDLPRIVLPPPAPRTVSVTEALRRRRSSFGRFSALEPLSQQELSTMLAAGQRSAGYACDVSTEDGLELVTTYLFVNHVRDVPPGAYRYEPATGSIVQVAAGKFGEFLQQHYYLENYNLEQTAAVLVPTVRASAVLSAVGDRGYRLVNATVGAVTQGLYLAAADLGIGCGAALGFDAVGYREQLKLDSTDVVPMIIVMIGHDRPARANFRYEIH